MSTLSCSVLDAFSHLKLGFEGGGQKWQIFTSSFLPSLYFLNSLRTGACTETCKDLLRRFSYVKFFGMVLPVHRLSVAGRNTLAGEGALV